MVQEAGGYTPEPTGGYVPIDVMEALRPWAFWAPDTAVLLAREQISNQLALADLQQRAAASAADVQARLAAAQASAGASIYGAQVSAQAAVDQELIRAKATLAGIQANIAADLQRAQGGDRNAAARLQAELGLQAEVANQATALQLAKLAGSGDLRDNFARLLYLKGYGPQPGVASALSGLPSPFIKAPTVQTFDYGPPPKVEGTSGGFTPRSYAPPEAPSFQMPSVIPMGGGGALPKIDMAQTFADIYSSLKQFQPSLGFGQQPSPPPAPPEGGMQLMAGGGTVRLRPGEAIVVGDPVRPGEPNPEMVKVRWGKYGMELDVVPLRKLGLTESDLRNVPKAATGFKGYMPEGSAGLGASTSGGRRRGQYWQDIVGRKYLESLKKPKEEPPVAPPEPAPPAPAPSPQPSGPTPPAWLTQPGIPVSQLPVVQELMGGAAGPAFRAIQRPTAPELGLGPVPLPFERATTFRQMSPAEQAQALQLWSYLGIPEDVARYWINVATPGWRTAARPVAY